MAGLQRSVTSFRRQGSSGLVWDDKTVAAGLQDMNPEEKNLNPNEGTEKLEVKELRPSLSAASIGKTERGRSTPTRTPPHQHRTAKVSSPLPYSDPPSPKVGSCGLFSSMFSKSADSKSKSKRRR